MEIFKIVLITIVATILLIVVASNSKEQALLLRIAVSIVLLMLLTGKIKDLYSDFFEIFDSEIISLKYFSIIVKVILIAYFAEFAADISKDAGENTIASNSLIAGKILILYISSPIFLEIIKKMISFITP